MRQADRVQGFVRSGPSVTADVMFRMVTDGNTKKVHYYSGPEGEAIL
ncbi:hypothetical protein ACPCTO_35485 [Streptomyces olivoreticuli]